MPDRSTVSSPDATRLVSFYLPERQALGGADPLTLDADRDWKIFGTGVYVWILQTFGRLHAAGAPVRLVEKCPSSGMVVAHAGQFDRLLAEAKSRKALMLVVAQSDRPPEPRADFSIVQNGRDANGDSIFIPSWLQPGIVPRPAERGSRVENIAYFGAIRELDPELAGPDWAAVLSARGLHWDSRTVTFSGNDQLYTELRWNDYSTTDVVVALRPEASRDARSKPAAKLQNAWAAGVPAILSPEAAYRELRRSRLDYLEARSASEALDAIEALRSDPGLYQEMVTNGYERAKDFAPDRLAARWREVLWREIPERASTLAYKLRVLARRRRAVARRLDR